MTRRNIPLVVDSAWERIVDTFRLDVPFTLRDATLIGWPHLFRQTNNLTRAARILEAEFKRIEVWTREHLDGPHIRQIRAGTPAVQTWVLPSGPVA